MESEFASRLFCRRPHQLFDPVLASCHNASRRTSMTKVATVALLVGVVLYFTGQQNVIAIALMVLGGLGLIGAIIWSNRR